MTLPLSVAGRILGGNPASVLVSASRNDRVRVSGDAAAQPFVRITITSQIRVAAGVGEGLLAACPS
jgi:hypothetical protein